MARALKRTIGAPQLVFALYVFGPALVFFLLPLAFFRLPLLVFLNNDKGTVVPANVVALAVGACLVWFAIAIGIVMWPSRASRVVRPREWTPGGLWTAFVAFSTLGSAVSLVHALRPLPAGIEEIVHQAFLAPPIGCVLGICLLQRDIVPGRRPIVWTLLAVDVVVAFFVPVVLSQIGRALFGAAAILYGLTMSGVSWRRLGAAALAVLPFVLVIFPLREYLRTQYYGLDPFHRGSPAQTPGATSLTPPVPMTFAERLADFDPWRNGLRFHRTEGRWLLAQFALARVIHRTNRLSDLAYVVQQTPAVVPYADGVTYKPLLSKLVPRSLWRHKPLETAGQFYGHRYSFIDPPDTVHSVNLPMVTEGWMNAGWRGVLLSSAFVGVVLRIIWTYWIGAGDAPASIVLGMAVVGTAVDGESNLSLVIGGVLHALVLYWAAVAVIGWWSRRTAPRSLLATRPRREKIVPSSGGVVR